MKKLIIFIFGLVAIAFATSCGGNKGNKDVASNALNIDSIKRAVADSISKADSIAQLKADSVAKVKDDSMNQAGCIAFITKMYNNKLFEDHAFLESHCSTMLLNRLKGDWDYDGEGYAVWDFRIETQQQEPSVSLQDNNGDGIDDFCGIDKNGDGKFDTAYMDANHDGINDTLVVDSDGDGKTDTFINDSDEDGNPDRIFS